MVEHDYQEIIRHLLIRIKDLEDRAVKYEHDYDQRIAIIDSLTDQIENLTVGNEAGGLLIHYDELNETYGGHTVASVSGGADYVGDFDTGFPRELTLARYEDHNKQARYVIDTMLRQKD